MDKQKSKKRKIDDEKWLKKQLAEGKSAQQILKIADDEVEEYFEAAKLFFEKERYQDALKTYHFLVVLNPSINEYWLGMAMSAQMCGDYQGALDAYAMASFTEVQSPIPYFRLAECLFALQDIENAMLALELAVELSADESEFAELKKQALQTKKLYQKKIFDSSEP